MSVPAPDSEQPSAPSGADTAGSLAADTPALRALAASGLAHTVVRTVPARNPEESAALQGIPLASLLRTIVVRRGADDYVFVLVPAGRRFDWPKLRTHLGVSRLSLPDQDEAKAVTGYERGAITPFGATRPWPVIADAAILDRERVAIGGGARGVNVHFAPADLVAALAAEVADVTVADVTVPDVTVAEEPVPDATAPGVTAPEDPGHVIPPSALRRESATLAPPSTSREYT